MYIYNYIYYIRLYASTIYGFDNPRIELGTNESFFPLRPKKNKKKHPHESPFPKPKLARSPRNPMVYHGVNLRKNHICHEWRVWLSHVSEKKTKKKLTYNRSNPNILTGACFLVGSPFSKSNRKISPHRSSWIQGERRWLNVQAFWARKCPVQPGDFFSMLKNMFQHVSCCARSCHWDLPNSIMGLGKQHTFTDILLYI